MDVAQGPRRTEEDESRVAVCSDRRPLVGTSPCDSLQKEKRLVITDYFTTKRSK